jgi:hypothetical protein
MGKAACLSIAYSPDTQRILRTGRGIKVKAPE